MDDECPLMICPSCGGAGQQQRATAAVDSAGRGHTLVHLYECRQCRGEGRVPLRPPV